MFDAVLNTLERRGKQPRSNYGTRHRAWNVKEAPPPKVWHTSPEVRSASLCPESAAGTALGERRRALRGLQALEQLEGVDLRGGVGMPARGE